MVLGAACWLLTLPSFAVEVVVAAAWPTSYTFRRNTISELGITACMAADGGTIEVCSPLHALMNATFVTVGVLTITGAILLRRTWPSRRMTYAGLSLLVLASFSTIATGVFPANVSIAAHAIASLPQFPAQNIGLLLLGISDWTRRRAHATLSLLSGGVGLTGLVLFVGAVPWGLGLGAMERLAVYPLAVWTSVIAVTVLRSRSKLPTRWSR